MKSHNRNQNFLRTAMAMTQKTGNGDIHVSMNVMRWRAGLKRPKKDYTYGLKADQLVTPAEKFAQKVRNGTNENSEFILPCFVSGKFGTTIGWYDAQHEEYNGDNAMVPGNVLLTLGQWKEMNNDETT